MEIEKVEKRLVEIARQNKKEEDSREVFYNTQEYNDLEQQINDLEAQIEKLRGKQADLVEQKVPITDFEKEYGNLKFYAMNYLINNDEKKYGAVSGKYKTIKTINIEKTKNLFDGLDRPQDFYDVIKITQKALKEKLEVEEFEKCLDIDEGRIYDIKVKV